MTRIDETLEMALCRQVDPEMWFPEKGRSGNVNAAKAVCRACPLYQPCFEAALYLDVDGIWAGTSPKERVKIRRTLGIRLPNNNSWDGEVA